MKRMVENSEKIEKLLDNVIINDNIAFKKKVIADYGLYSGDDSQFDGDVEFYGGLITNNITTKDGTKIDIINEEKYSLTATYNGSLSTLNLGTAIVVSGYIDVGSENGEYEIMTFHTDNMQSINIIQITGEPVCTIYADNGIITNTKAIKLRLNKAVAEYPVAAGYRFSFIIGRYGQEI